MLRGEDVVGVIAVSRAQPGRFESAEIAVLQTFADQAVIAVENARLLTELHERTLQLQRSVGQLTALGEVGQAVSSSLDLETVLTTIVSRAVQLSGVDGGVVFEYDEAAEEFEPARVDRAGALASAPKRTQRKREAFRAPGHQPRAVEVSGHHERGRLESRLRESMVESGGRRSGGAMLRNTSDGQPGRDAGSPGFTRRRSSARTFATQSASPSRTRALQPLEWQPHIGVLRNMSQELRTT